MTNNVDHIFDSRSILNWENEIFNIFIYTLVKRSSLNMRCLRNLAERKERKHLNVKRSFLTIGA